jgi:hypothetical protein
LCGSWRGLEGEGASGEVTVVGTRDGCICTCVYSRDWISSNETTISCLQAAMCDHDVRHMNNHKLPYIHDICT